MNIGIYKILKKNHWIISRTIVIILTINLTILAGACSTPHAVRDGSGLRAYHKQKVKNQTNDHKIRKNENDSYEYARAGDEIINEIEQFEKKLKNNNDIEEQAKEETYIEDDSMENQNDNYEDDYADDYDFTKPSNRLPTLREQMKMLADEQEKINSEIYSMQDDIRDIKNSLRNLEEEFRMFNKNSEPIKGGGEKSVTGAANREELSKGENIILSDEAKAKKEQDKSVNISRDKDSQPKQTSRTNESDDNTNNKTKKMSDPAIDDEQKEFNNAMNYYTRNDYRQAIDEMEKIKASSESREMKSKCDYWIGESYFGLRDYDKAIDYYSKVIESDKSYRKDKAQVMIAESYIRCGKVSKAKVAFDSLIKQFPESEYVPRARKMLQQL